MTGHQLTTLRISGVASRSWMSSTSSTSKQYARDTHQSWPRMPTMPRPRPKPRPRGRKIASRLRRSTNGRHEAYKSENSMGRPAVCLAHSSAILPASDQSLSLQVCATMHFSLFAIALALVSGQSVFDTWRFSICLTADTPCRPLLQPASSVPLRSPSSMLNVSTTALSRSNAAMSLVRLQDFKRSLRMVPLVTQTHSTLSTLAFQPLRTLSRVSPSSLAPSRRKERRWLKSSSVAKFALQAATAIPIRTLLLPLRAPRRLDEGNAA